MIICDTDILIEYLKGNPEICSELDFIGEQNLSISIITYAELVRGSFNRKEQTNIKKQIESLKIINISNEVSIQFRIIMDLYSLSHKISIPDALIAASAMVSDLQLFTRNVKDFKFIKNIQLYTIRR